MQQADHDVLQLLEGFAIHPSKRAAPNRFRVHGPDPSAPPGSNSFEGPTYRWQIGNRYVGEDGTLYPQGVSNPNSPYFDPAGANATHIPWPGF